MAPRTFEAAMHFSSSISRGVFEKVVDHDRAAGIPVRTSAGSELPRFARRGLEGLAHSQLVTLQATGRTTTLRFPGAARDIVDVYAILESVVAGARWFLASRLVWRLHDFADGEGATTHDRIILAAECDESDDVGIYRLSYDDVEGAAIHRAVRDLLLRELVLRPAFEKTPAFSRITPSVPRTGEDGDEGDS